MQITNIDHINVVVTNLNSAKIFFEKLGLEASEEVTLSGEWIDKTVQLKDVRARFVSLSMSGAKTTIELIQYENPAGQSDASPNTPNRIGFRHLAFTVTDIHAWYEKLINLGIECFSEVQTVPNYKGKKIVYFRGPDNIILELAEYS